MSGEFLLKGGIYEVSLDIPKLYERRCQRQTWHKVKRGNEYGR